MISLKYLLLFYFFSIIVLNGVTLFDINFDYYRLDLYSYNAFYAVIYSSILVFLCSKTDKITLNSAFKFSIALGLIYLAGLKYIFFRSTGEFFVFSAADTLYYHDNAMEWLNTRLDDGILKFLRHDDFYHLGAVFYTYFLYFLVPHPLSVDVVNFLICIITGYMLYTLLKRKLAHDYAIFFFVAFLLSPLTLGFSFTHYKESLLTFLIVGFFFSFIFFYEEKKLFFLGTGITCLFFMIFFRPVLIPIIALAIFFPAFQKTLHDLLRGRTNQYLVLITIAALFAIVYGADYVEIYIGRLGGLLTDGVESVNVPIQNEMFARIVSFFSAIFGPFPVFGSTYGFEARGIFAAGVYFNLLLAYPFLLGSYQIYKFGTFALKVTLYFVILHSLTLGYIFRGFDPRFTVIHKPLYLFIAAWGLTYVGYKSKLVNKLILVMSFLFLFIITLFYQQF